MYILSTCFKICLFFCDFVYEYIPKTHNSLKACYLNMVSKLKNLFIQTRHKNILIIRFWVFNLNMLSAMHILSEINEEKYWIGINLFACNLFNFIYSSYQSLWLKYFQVNIIYFCLFVYLQIFYSSSFN